MIEALVTMAQTLLRVRGEWHGGATAFADIELAVSNVADLVPDATLNQKLCAIREIKRRAI